MEFSIILATVWVALIIFFIIVEIASVQLISIWFAAGSFAAFIATFFKVSWQWQILIFIAVSLISMIAMRKFAKEKITPKIVPTNSDELIGQHGIVIHEINGLRGEGRVKIAGQDWSAALKDENATLEKGKACVIKSIEGVKLVVAPL